MHYGRTTLPVTGGGIGLSIATQSLIIAVAFIVATLLGFLIHYKLFRPDKSIGE